MLSRVSFWRKAAVRSNVRSWGQSGKHMLALSFSAFDPGRVETILVPQQLQVTQWDRPRCDRLSLFLLNRDWNQSRRILGRPEPTRRAQRDTLPQACIAARSGLIPTMFITRVRL